IYSDGTLQPRSIVDTGLGGTRKRPGGKIDSTSSSSTKILGGSPASSTGTRPASRIRSGWLNLGLDIVLDLALLCKEVPRENSVSARHLLWAPALAVVGRFSVGQDAK